MSDLIDRAEAISRAVELRMYGKPVKMVAVSELERLPKHGETTLPEQAYSDRLGVKTGETCADVISRQAAMVVINCSGLDDDSKDTVVRVLEQLPSAQPETHGKRTETHACDCISRQAAIDAIGILLEQSEDDEHDKTWNNAIRSSINAVKHHLPSVQPEQSDTSEFWRKRADYYSDMCMNLIGEMGRGVEIESVKINENGIEFIKKQPPAQSIDLQELEDRFGEYVRFVVNDMLTGEGKRWTR